MAAHAEIYVYGPAAGGDSTAAAMHMVALWWSWLAAAAAAVCLATISCCRVLAHPIRCAVVCLCVVRSSLLDAVPYSLCFFFAACADVWPLWRCARCAGIAARARGICAGMKIEGVAALICVCGRAADGVRRARAESSDAMAELALPLQRGAAATLQIHSTAHKAQRTQRASLQTGAASRSESTVHLLWTCDGSAARMQQQQQHSVDELRAASSAVAVQPSRRARVDAVRLAPPVHVRRCVWCPTHGVE